MDKSRRILLIGGYGLAGCNLRRVYTGLGYDVRVTARKPIAGDSYCYRADLTDTLSVKRVIDAFDPGLTILSAAMTNVDLCEDQRDLAYAVNVKAPREIAGFCRDAKSKIVYLSTDYIFDGKDGPYAEESVPNPVSYYGWTKCEGERFVSAEAGDPLVIRTTVVYGFETAQKNFVYGLIRSLRQGDTRSVPVDQVGTPTYAYDMARKIERLTARGSTGVFNVAGADLIDRYEFSRKICRVFGLDFSLVKPVSTDQLGQKAVRPLKAGLITDKVSRILSERAIGADEGLEKFKIELENK